MSRSKELIRTPSPYCDHPEEETTYTEDARSCWGGMDARCSACGHEWYITAKEWSQMHPPAKRERANNDIIF